MEITSFSGEYEFLSNFYNVPVRYVHDFGNSEAAYQAQKALNPADAEDFTQYNGGKAKRKGRKLAVRPDWQDVRLACMRDVLFAKFFQNPALAAQLLATGDATVIEGNDWHDTFWGVDAETGDGQNHLGKILMAIRDELKAPELSLHGGENLTLTRFSFPAVDGSRLTYRLSLPGREETELNFARVYKIERRDGGSLDGLSSLTWRFHGRTFTVGGAKDLEFFRDDGGVHLIRRRHSDVLIYAELKNPPVLLGLTADS